MTNFSVGDCVLYHGNLRRKTFGGFAQYTVHDSLTAIKLDKQVTREEAIAYAALPCAGWTAYHACFKKLKLFDTCKKVNYVLVTGMQYELYMIQNTRWVWRCWWILHSIN